MKQLRVLQLNLSGIGRRSTSKMAVQFNLQGINQPKYVRLFLYSEIYGRPSPPKIQGCQIDQQIQRWYKDQLQDSIANNYSLIVKWTSSITNSLALICNTVLKRCSVALNGSG